MMKYSNHTKRVGNNRGRLVVLYLSIYRATLEGEPFRGDPSVQGHNRRTRF